MLKEEMTEEEFYKLYFNFIESIQCIENRLRYMYAHIKGIVGSSSWFDDFESVECDTIGRLVYLIKKEEKERGTNYLSDEMCSRLNEIREIRNFWVHKCCIAGCIGFTKTDSGNVLRTSTAQKMKKDEILAWDLNEDLFKEERALK